MKSHSVLDYRVSPTTTHCGLQVETGGLKALGSVWQRCKQQTPIWVVESEPTCMNCKASARLAATREAARIKPVTPEEVSIMLATTRDGDDHDVEMLADRINERFGVK